jgi:hypothetical protein
MRASVVSPPNAATVSPRLPLAFPLLKNAVAPSPAGFSVSKQNTPSVPKLHVDSFQDFGDVLHTALSRSEAPLNFENGWASSVEPGLSEGSGMQPVPEPAAGAKSGTVVNSTPETTAAPQPQGAAVQADSNETATNSAASEQPAAFDLRVRPPLAKVEQVGKAEAEDDSRPSQPQVNGSATASQLIGITNAVDQSPTENWTFRSSGPPQSVGVSAVRAGSPPAQNARADQAFSRASQSETEAFRIDLRPDADLIEESGSTRSASGTMASNEASRSTSASRAAATPSGENFQQVAGANAPTEQSGREQSAAASRDRAASVPDAESPAPSRKQPAAASPDESTPSEKTLGDAAAESARASMGATPNSFDTAVRTFGAPREPLEAIRPGETPKIAEGAAPNETKEVLVKFQGAAGDVVTVRLLDQGGQVQVAVRSTDPVAAAQLRQDLGSLTSSLERFGWKADPTTVATEQNPMTHDAQPSHGDGEGGGNRSNPDWNEDRENKRRASSELWDAVFGNQNA